MSQDSTTIWSFLEVLGTLSPLLFWLAWMAWSTNNTSDSTLDIEFRSQMRRSHKVSLLDFCLEARCSTKKGKNYLKKKVRDFSGVWIDEEYDSYAVFRDEIQNTLIEGEKP